MEFLEMALDIFKGFWQKIFELGTYIINDNWGPIQSIAIIAAVIVAILAIRKNEKQKKAMARNIRARLLAEIAILRPLVERGLDPKSTLSSFDLLRLQEHITIIKEIFPQAHILSAKEHDILTSLIINLSVLQQFGPRTSEAIKEIMHLLNLGFLQFGTRGFLQSQTQSHLAVSSQDLEGKEAGKKSKSEPKVV